MRIMLRFVCIATMFAASVPVSAASRQGNLDTWLMNELTPFVREQLMTHPRFKGESLRFVVLDNGNPQATSNALALRIRDRLREAAADVPAVRVAWQPDDPHYLRNSQPGGVDCTKSEVHYLIGIEMTPIESGLLSIELRALDVEDGTVVAGFTRSWTGHLNSREYREFRHFETDPTFRGEREAPYEKSQSDLLAAHLAHDLGCNLLRQTEAEYVITGLEPGTEADPVSSMVELVSNNLAQYSSLQFSSTDDNANSVIEGKAHKIDEDLYQYWITVHPKNADSDLQAFSASAYVRLPEQFMLAERAAVTSGPAIESDADFLASLSIVELQDPQSCVTRGLNTRSPGYRREYGDCYALQVQSKDDAVVFFLNHQLNNGLVRLADRSCPQRTSAKIARTGQQLRFALPQDSLPSAEWSAAEGWLLQPELDTYYAVATTNTKAARALSQHIEELPKRCSASVRPGMEGHALRQWMEELQAIINHWEPAIDWQTIRVRNIY
ncbi:MAG: hypothetical protein OEM63_10840 [Gammaproteobacteria bacterium]|nr:hypothetical protein [Gammaproteobacteria bacterium]